jgi:hypothetical protein
MVKPRSIVESLLRLVHAPARPANLRLLIVSTPRVGNTWTRILLTKLYGFDEVPNGELFVHDPSQVPWDNLPPRCILQLHWHRVEPFLTLLRKHRFRSLTLVRHPLDVLISVLQLSQHTTETACWLGSEGGDESPILGASPRSDAFLSYATGPRAKALLSVSLEWWNSPRVLKARYEDLVQDTTGCYRSLTAALGHVESQRLEAAIASCALDRLVTATTGPHFWQGKPGLWKSLIPADEAHAITAAHEKVFRTFGYKCDPDYNLTAAQADANWAFFRDNPRTSRKSKSA